ncbi:hypothetical protein [Caudoviricetes sp.]|nr:hypothetical protein [Caudoviricetes sp.]UOF81899.1 hypothetical protein [Caudoviricetes sp.]
MLTAFLAWLLAVGPNEQVVRQGKGADGGVAWTVDCLNCSGGSGGSGPSYVNVLVDGGWMTVTVLNPTPTYVNVLVDGGFVTTQVVAALPTGANVIGGVTQSGTWSDTPRQVSSANNTGTCVSVSTLSTTVLADNASRRAYGFKASEDNTARVYCKLGAMAATSNTVFGAGSSWSQDTGAVYTGVIDCIAASGTQSVCVYEMN